MDEFSQGTAGKHGRIDVTGFLKPAAQETQPASDANSALLSALKITTEAIVELAKLQAQQARHTAGKAVINIHAHGGAGGGGSGGGGGGGG